MLLNLFLKFCYPIDYVSNQLSSMWNKNKSFQLFVKLYLTSSLSFHKKIIQTITKTDKHYTYLWLLKWTVCETLQRVRKLISVDLETRQTFTRSCLSISTFLVILSHCVHRQQTQARTFKSHTSKLQSAFVYSADNEDVTCFVKTVRTHYQIKNYIVLQWCEVCYIT